MDQDGYDMSSCAQNISTDISQLTDTSSQIHQGSAIISISV